MEFNDIRLQYEELSNEIQSAITQVLSSGRYILGPVGQAFEADFARYCGVSRGVGVASGTDALRIGLSAIGVRPGDEVLVPAVSAAATAMAVVQLHARPVFVDIIRIISRWIRRAHSIAPVRERGRWFRFIFMGCRRI